MVARKERRQRRGSCLEFLGVLKPGKQTYFLLFGGGSRSMSVGEGDGPVSPLTMSSTASDVFSRSELASQRFIVSEIPSAFKADKLALFFLFERGYLLTNQNPMPLPQ